MRITTINGLPKRANWKLHLFVTALSCVIALFLSKATIAQTVLQSKLNCPDGHCTSKDLSVVDVFVDVPPCTTCNGGTVTAPLKMTIHNGTKSERTSFALYGTLSTGSINGVSGNIFVCVGPITVKSDQNIGAGVGNQTFTVGTITFNCTQTLTLTNNFLAWTDASGTTTDRCNTFANATKCSDIEPKCGTAATITIRQPLTASYTATPGCTGRSAGKIKITPVGGTPNYTVVLKKNNITVATQTNVTTAGYEFTGLAEGTDYSATITDATNPPATHCTYTLTPITLGSFFCCTAPTVASNPSPFDACSGNTASFSATYSGGDPTPTSKWQKKAPGDASFSDLTIDGVIYTVSSITSGTKLDISNVNGLGGYQYRAVFTSGDCAPANTSGAALTVYQRPTLPAFTITQPTLSLCSNASTDGAINFCTTTTGYTYKVGDKTAITGNGSAQSVGGLAAGSNPSIIVTNTNTGTIAAGCANTFSCSDAVSTCGGITQKESPIQNSTLVEAPATVKAYPNPFNDKVKFAVNSPDAGNGSLEIYNLLGQKIKTVYQGRINAGNQVFEMSIPKKQQATLIYVFRVGSRQITGKLMQLNN